MKVIFFPFDHNNPYQSSLKVELEQLGVEVEIGELRRWLPLGQAGLGRVDVVHLHWLLPILTGPSWVRTVIKGSLVLLHLCLLRLTGTRVAWTAHNLRPHEQRFDRTERVLRALLARLSNVIFVHCEAARQAVKQRCHLRSDNHLVTIPHGHYAHWYENTMTQEVARQHLGIDPDRFMVLFFGGIRQYKGVSQLIDAFSGLDRHDVDLVIAGRPYREDIANELRSQAAHFKNVHLHFGFVEDADVQKYMNAADVVACPYVQSLTSGAVILGMSFGRPCIAPKMGCLAEHLDESTAVLYDLARADGLTQALREAVDRRSELSAMGKAAYHRAMTWDWSEITQTTLRAYRR